jgi:hypothetical protein
VPISVPIYRSLPEPWRGRIGLRRSRRWAQAKLLQRQHNARQPADAPVVNFYPMLPGPNSSIVTILRRLPARIGNEPTGGALTVAWDTGTWFAPAAARRLPADAINGRCLDISKSRVDRLWAEASGYSIAVDPLTTAGPIVVKPELNGMHAGRVVEGPLDRRREDVVYQRLIDSRDESGRVLQLRVVVWAGAPLFVYAKWRAHPDWFGETDLTLPKGTRDYLSAEEERTIVRFVAAMGIDYAEIDAVRDRDSGLIYVVDVNRTSVRPKALPPEMEDPAFAPQAAALERLLGGGSADSER